MAAVDMSEHGGDDEIIDKNGGYVARLQSEMKLFHVDGKYLTRQEKLLHDLFFPKEAEGITTANTEATFTSPPQATAFKAGSYVPSTTAGGTPQVASLSTAAASTTTSSTTPRQKSQADRERVQNFLLQRQHSGSNAGTPKGASSTSTSTNGTSSGTNVTTGLSAMERAKQLMAKKSKPSLGRTNSFSLANTTGSKRSNPLADILKGGSVVNSTTTNNNTNNNTPPPAPAKRPRTVKSDRPGEIKIQGGRSSIQLPLESFLRTEDWDSAANQTPLDLVLPEVAFATNNTLVIHATIPSSSHRCCFNLSTQSSLLSGATPPGTVLYHFNPRRNRQVVQNSNIDGRWGCAQPLPRSPITFGEPFTLRLTAVPTGFLVFIEEVFQDEFRHRVPIREGENLVLSIPTRDENGNAESVIVHSVWWGHAQVPSHLQNQNGNAPSNTNPNRFRQSNPRGGRGGRFSNPHPYEVYVGNLPQGTTRDELGFLFQYLGYETVRITARGFGFVTLKSQDDMNRAVEEMDGKEFKGTPLRVSCALPPSDRR